MGEGLGREPAGRLTLTLPGSTAPGRRDRGPPGAYLAKRIVLVYKFPRHLCPESGKWKRVQTDRKFDQPYPWPVGVGSLYQCSTSS